MKITKITATMAILGLTSLFAADGATLFKTCATCHGANAEKQALGKSQVIKGWDAAKIEAALKGYKDGSYGGAMKGVMKGQTTRLSDADIKALAGYISAMK
ncbi:cytochrome C [Halarcobacter ebronensis]|uniref:Cytochrome C n=1 Tax=Halarcobacter ebronensis TaxID=1462615 RepID=A0A4Q1AXV6_9BACT|nr:c-type cytochrome [Halarcobacter ebronensis]QKF82230.1 periplasmic monoheme cytochrome c553 [Halarcobacter ebronensis]RXJ70060.1 cytochrome C [Halarcobacter ebronensis]RXK07736.1 cytochrome C [Halarcobacter ebronensis]